MTKAASGTRSSQGWISDNSDFLASLGLIDAGLVRNSAVVLFHKQASRILQQTRVRAVAFRTNDLKELVDNRVLEGHAFALYEQIESFLRRNLPVASVLPDNESVRRDTPAYPWGALREGIMNALAHRDYAAFDGQLSIQIKPTQIEIWNPGRLPEGMTVEELVRGHVSRPPNPDIAHVFFLRGLIERVGIGTQRIVHECQAAGLPDPVWSLRAGGVSLTLRLPESVLGERQMGFLRVVRPLRTITTAEYSTLFTPHISRSNAQRDLTELEKLGFLIREGKGAATTYRRTNKLA